jgi:ubiquinone biosynthesis protein
VYVGVLRGRAVAVKVQRPGVEADFNGDIRLLIIAMRLIKRLRIKSLDWVLDPGGEFVDWTREELDYRREARYAERLRRNADTNPYERAPAIMWDLTTRRTLVMEFMSGTTVRLSARGPVRRRIDHLSSACGGIRTEPVCSPHHRQLPRRRVPAWRLPPRICIPPIC